MTYSQINHAKAWGFFGSSDREGQTKIGDFS